MKKNLRSCIEQPVFGESTCLLDMGVRSVAESSGLAPDPQRKQTLRWSFAESSSVRFPLDAEDLSAFRFLTFSVWAASGAGGTFSLRFESDETVGGAGGFVCTLPITHNGWNDYRIELPFLRTTGTPVGWDRVRAVVLDCVAGGQTNRSETVLSIGNFSVWQGIAPYLYLKRPELKGAAAFSVTGCFAIVDRRRIPLAPDASFSVKPFEKDGTIWVPMGPVAAIFGHKAVADNKAATLNFIYRRKKYAFGTESGYTVDGVAVPLDFCPKAVEGTLFFPVDYVRDFFRWRWTFTDPTGLIILSNRKQIFNRSLEAPFLWNLCAELTLPQPRGREISDDLHRRTPTASRGRLLLVHDEWMALRRTCKTDDFSAMVLRKIKADYGKSSDAFRLEPTLKNPATDAKTRQTQYRIAADRMIAFGTLYRITGEKPYAERVAAEGEALAAMPSWDAETDLVGAATVALGMAIGYDWCHTAWSEARKMKTEHAMLRYAMRPGLDAYRGKAAMWRAESPESARINAGMIASALVLADAYPETACRILDRAPASLAKCFAAYSPDGGYAEGVGAWEESTRALVITLAMLESACGKTYGFDSLPGFSATALFGVVAATENGAWNDDRSVGAALNASFLPWFTRRYGSHLPAWIRRRELRMGKKEPDVWDLIFRTSVDETAKAQLPLDAVYRKAGLAVLRSDWGDRATFLSLHGGSNPMDGKCDAGAFLLESEGERFFTDISGEANLSERLRFSAVGQNTIAVGKTEADTPEQDPAANAALLEARGSVDRAYAVADMSEIHERVLRGKRGVLLTDDRRVAVIQDELTLAVPSVVVWTAYTPANVEILHTRYAILERNGKRLICRFAGAAGKWEAERLGETNLTRLTVRIRVREKTRFAVACKPYCEGDDRNEPFYSVRPIGTWSET